MLKTVLAPGVAWPTSAPTGKVVGGRGWKRPQLSCEQVMKARELRRSGVTLKSLCETYNVTRTTMSNVISALGPYAKF